MILILTSCSSGNQPVMPEPEDIEVPIEDVQLKSGRTVVAAYDAVIDK